MSLSVPQNGVKADNEPVIELFVKVRPQQQPHGTSFTFSTHLTEPTVMRKHCNDKYFISAVEIKATLTLNVRYFHKGGFCRAKTVKASYSI